jgi:hypothetical protein
MLSPLACARSLRHALSAAADVDFCSMQWQLATGQPASSAAARSGVVWRYLSRDLAAVAGEATKTPA